MKKFIKKIGCLLLAMLLALTSTFMLQSSVNVQAKTGAYVKSLKISAKKAKITIPVSERNAKKSFKIKVKTKGKKISKKVIAKSNNKNVASVKLNSKKTKLTVIGKKAGKAVITVTTKGKSKKGKKIAKKLAITVKKERVTAFQYYTLNFNSNGGSYVASQNVEEGKMGMKPNDPTKEGYVFDGWYSDSNLTSAYDFLTGLTSDITLYAKWKVNSLDIEIENNIGGSETNTIVTQDESLIINGTVSGNDTVSKIDVTYSDYSGNEKNIPVSGTSFWSAEIPLEVGTGIVKVIAYGVHDGIAEKTLSVNRTSKTIEYSKNVKIADEKDYNDLENSFVACWVDDNGTPEVDSDDTIVLLAEEDSILLGQINRGLLDKGDVYMIPQNKVFVTGFTAVYDRHQAPRGTENYPTSEYPDNRYEEIIFTYPSFADIFDDDVSLDFSEGIDMDDPIAFAMLADGTPINATVEREPLVRVSSQKNMSPQNDIDKLSIRANEDMIGNPLYPRKGWQPEELATNVLPSLKASLDQNNCANITLNWDDIVIYDKDGVKNSGAINTGQLKLSGEIGIKNLKYTGGIEWHPSLIPWNIELLPQQVMSKLDYTFSGLLELKGATSVSTTELVKSLNNGFDNKSEFWGMKVSGVSTFNDKWVLGVVGFNLLPPSVVVANSISSQAAASTLQPSLILFIFVDLDGNVSVEGGITFGYETSVEKGFNLQKNGYTGGYGSQNQNRSDNHYDIGSNYTLDIYDTNEGNFKLSFGGEVDASLDLGIGVGSGVMIGGICPGLVNGEIFYRAAGDAEGEIEFLPNFNLNGVASLYQGVGAQADADLKMLLETKIGSTGLDFNKHWEHMLWEQDLSTSYLKGNVYVADNDGDDENNEKIQGVKVTLIKTDTGRNWTTETDQNGKYRFNSIPDGAYVIKFQKDGFDTYEKSDVIFSKRGTIDAFLNKQSVLDGQCTLSGKITIADDDTNQTNNLPLEGADILLVNNQTFSSVSAQTASDGTYLFERLPSGNYTITISKDGYITILEAVSIADNIENYYNALIEAVSNDYAGVGTASGTVYDAFNGKFVPDLTLNIRSGVSMANGSIEATVKTNENGEYITPELPAGNYTVQVVDDRQLGDEKDRYYNSTYTIKILGGHTIPNQDGYVTNGLNANQLRIVLKWGETPSDLDSHLVGPTNSGESFHTYFSHKAYYDDNDNEIANLDLDDTSSYGPETTTIYESSPGIYTYLVHDYSNADEDFSEALANSGAYVEVYMGNSAAAAYTFNVPTSDGTLWTVFSYNSNTGELTPVNSMSYEPDESDVGKSCPVR